MTGTDEQQLIRDLRRPEAWPGEEGEIGFVQTHISLVLLGRERVLKLKRPVHYSFVDYSTVGKRRQACHDEVRLNRLLSDDIYLGVVPIVRDDDGFRIGGEGDEAQAVEWGTWMRRIDDGQLLDGLLRGGEVPARLADRLADRLVPFHHDRPPVGEAAPDEAVSALLAVVTENLDEVRGFAGDPLPSHELATIDRAMRAFIHERRDVLRQRVVDGWVREGHGDLRSEHVVVPPASAVQVFDCVEFNRDLRVADVASDLAFLLMDLYRLGAPVVEVQGLVERYEAAGIVLPTGLLRLYWMHRALVRAKVHGLRLAELRGDAWLAVVWKAVDYVHLAHRQAITMRPALIAMTGLSGTGKSSLAKVLARATGMCFLDTDIIRGSAAYLGGDLARARGEDIYTAEWTTRTYGRLIAEGSESVRNGTPAILDGTFLDRALRDQAASAARELGVPFVMVEVRCDEEEVFRRLERRVRDPARTSDAGVEIHRRQRDRLRSEPPGLPDGTIHVMVDTTQQGPVSIDPVLRTLEDAGIIVPGIREDGELI